MLIDVTLADEDAISKVVDVFVEEHINVSFLTAEILTTVQHTLFQFSDRLNNLSTVWNHFFQQFLWQKHIALGSTVGKH